jgi:hypothetical protein
MWVRVRACVGCGCVVREREMTVLSEGVLCVLGVSPCVWGLWVCCTCEGIEALVVCDGLCVYVGVCMCVCVCVGVRVCVGYAVCVRCVGFVRFFSHQRLAPTHPPFVCTPPPALSSVGHAVAVMSTLSVVMASYTFWIPVSV